ncbi:Cytochrome P450 4C1 [Eumeta japonica]|uniref:Cytochrome P450 4C1 n=1 Tax=Eumeta variegata TaxID=151549 RepID=A0A4C1V2I9_EUMVA|nr:Cytochrome P450 4C1 [Eumeta japonica]
MEDKYRDGTAIEKLYKMMRPAVVVTNPEDAEVVLNTCLEKDYFYKFAYLWVGEGLITATVPTWKLHHKKLLPAFNQNVLNSFMDVFNRQSSVMVEAMAKELGKGEFDAYAYIGAATLEIICQTAMGTPMGQQNIVNPPYLDAVHKMFNVMTERAAKIWLHPQFMYNLLGYKKVEDDALRVLHHVSNTVVQKKRLEFLLKEKNKEKKPEIETERPFRAFLDLMLELTAKEGIFTEQEIREEVDTIIVAGQETTGYIVLYTLLLLGTHQEQQQKVYNEMQQILGDSDRDLTKEDLTHFVHLEAILKETMRIYPIVPLMVRKVERNLKLRDYTLPAGSGCAVSLWGLHRHERWGPDYDSFRPERWLDAGALPAHPAAFAAFGHGRRGCVESTLRWRTRTCHRIGDKGPLAAYDEHRTNQKGSKAYAWKVSLIIERVNQAPLYSTLPRLCAVLIRRRKSTRGEPRSGHPITNVPITDTSFSYLSVRLVLVETPAHDRAVQGRAELGVMPCRYWDTRIDLLGTTLVRGRWILKSLLSTYENKVNSRLCPRAVLLALRAMHDRKTNFLVQKSQRRCGVVTNPQDAETVLNTCLEKDFFYKFAYPWIGQGLVTATVPTWKLHHKKLLPAFNQNVLNGFMDVFNRQSSVMAEAMAKELGKGEFDAYAYIGAATLEMICQTAMGTPMGQQNVVNPPYLEAVNKLLIVLTKRAAKIWLHPQFMYKLLGYKKIEDDALRVLHHVSNTVGKRLEAPRAALVLQSD